MGGNGRCKAHGGLQYQVSHSLTMGTRAQYLPKELKARFEDLTGDAIEGLEETVKIQQAMETQLLDQLQSGESHEAWKLINELCIEYSYGDDEQREATFSRIHQTAQGGLKAYGVKKEILDLHERTRKQTETLVKCRKEVQETFTREMWNEMLSNLLQIMTIHCDRPTLRRIGSDIQKAQLLKGGELDVEVVDTSIPEKLQSK